MENGTSTCSEFEEIVAIKNINERLEKVAFLFEKKEGIKLNFCRIYGKRWSFIAGDPRMVIPELKIVINENYGVIVENNTLEQKTWDALIKCFKQIVETR